MPRLKFKTLTEQMFYVLLCLKTECSGIELFDRIKEMSEGRVCVGSGTMYNLLEQFLEAGMIREVQKSGRKRTYIITAAGDDMLREEKARLQRQLKDYEEHYEGGQA